MITEKDVEYFLYTVFDEVEDETVNVKSLLGEAIDDYDGDEIEVETYENAGVLTDDRGLVVKIGGVEFQITIVEC